MKIFILKEVKDLLMSLLKGKEFSPEIDETLELLKKDYDQEFNIYYRNRKEYYVNEGLSEEKVDFFCENIKETFGWDTVKKQDKEMLPGTTIYKCVFLLNDKQEDKYNLMDLLHKAYEVEKDSLKFVHTNYGIDI